MNFIKNMFSKSILRNIFRKDEVEFVLDSIINHLVNKEVLLPEEIDNFCVNLSLEGKQIVRKRLLELGCVFDEDMVLLSKRMIGRKRIEEKELLSYLIRPEYIDTKKDFIQVGNQFYQGITATGFPSTVAKNWMGRLSEEKANMDFSVYISPSSVRAMEDYLSGQLRQVDNDLFKYKQKGLDNPSLENRKKELLEQLNAIIKGEFKLYKIGLYLVSKGVSPKNALTMGKKILSSLQAEGIEAEPASYLQEKLLKSVIPASTNYIFENELIVPGPAAAASFPFSSSFYEVDEQDGILLGFNDRGIPIGKSIWKLPKYIGAVLGSTGSGKSYGTKALLLNDQLVNGTKVVVLDPEGEYVDMANTLPSSQVVSLNRKSKTIPNVLNLMGSNLVDKLVALPKVFDVLLDGVTDIQKPLLERAVVNAYHIKGIYEDNEKSWKCKAPILSDVLKELHKLQKRTKNQSSITEYEVLISKLSRYTDGIFKFINQSGKDINLDADFIVFEFKEMSDEIRPVMMLILLEFVKTKFQLDTKKKMLVLDEAWRLLKNKNEADYVEGFARTFRKRNGSLVLVTQSVAELKDSPEGKAFLANTAFRYILKTEKIVLDETCELFGLNESEKEIISNARPGEGILIWENKHYKINIHVDPETHKLITTDPNE
jgi:conjugal transfer ATP-binding protein TraC